MLKKTSSTKVGPLLFLLAFVADASVSSAFLVWQYGWLAMLVEHLASFLLGVLILLLAFFIIRRAVSSCDLNSFEDENSVRNPAYEEAEEILCIAGILLIFPGIMSDLLGVLLLLESSRRAIVASICESGVRAKMANRTRSN